VGLQLSIHGGEGTSLLVTGVEEGKGGPVAKSMSDGQFLKTRRKAEQTGGGTLVLASQRLRIINLGGTGVVVS